MAFLGIDLGTGGVRCLLVNEEGNVLTEITKPLHRVNLSDRSGESEQDPRHWIALLEDALDELFSVPSLSPPFVCFCGFNIRDSITG